MKARFDAASSSIDAYDVWAAELRIIQKVVRRGDLDARAA